MVEDSEVVYNHITPSESQNTVQENRHSQVVLLPSCDLQQRKKDWVIDFQEPVRHQTSKHLRGFHQGLQSRGEEYFNKWIELTTRSVERLFGQEKKILENISVRTTSIVIFTLLPLRDVNYEVIQKAMRTTLIAFHSTYGLGRY